MSLPDLKTGQNNRRLKALLAVAERDIHHAIHCAAAAETGDGAVRHSVRNAYATIDTARALVEDEL